MRDSDIRVADADVGFLDVKLEQALTLANHTISEFTVAKVLLHVEDRTGRRSTGTGISTLSVPWSWPRGNSTFSQRDAHLRSVVVSLVEQVRDAGYGDPFEHWDRLASGLARFADAGDAGSAPRLALDLALGAVDNAIHDSWSRVIGAPALELYNAEFLSGDAGRWLGPEFSEIWPGHGRGAPRNSLPVQHVVGVSDPIFGPTHDAVTGRSLEDWVRREHFESVKIKLSGSDPESDAARVAEIAGVMSKFSQSFDLALDANEGYTDVERVLELLDSLKSRAPSAVDKLSYVEQPVSRDQEPNLQAMETLRKHLPVVIDEGLGEIRQLAGLRDEGWGGLVVKAAKGQSFAVLCQTFASRTGMFFAIQDLTATGLALEHSARLASALPVSSLSFEYNSRQYAPKANADLAERRPELVRVNNGKIIVGQALSAGIY